MNKYVIPEINNPFTWGNYVKEIESHSKTIELKKIESD